MATVATCRVRRVASDDRGAARSARGTESPSANNRGRRPEREPSAWSDSGPSLAAPCAGAGIDPGTDLRPTAVGSWRPEQEDNNVWPFFGVSPPRFSIAYGVVALGGLAASLGPGLTLAQGRLQLPSEGLRLLILAGLCAQTASLWARWLSSIGRLVVSAGLGVWADLRGSFRLTELFVSGHTLIGANSETSICVRLAGALNNEEWQPSTRSALAVPEDGYRAQADGADGWLRNTSFRDRSSLPALSGLGGDVRRWYRTLPMTLLFGVGASSLVSPGAGLEQVTYSMPSYAWILVTIGLLLLVAVGAAVFALFAFWMLDLRWRRKGSVDGVWLWRRLGRLAAGRPVVSRLLLGWHLTDSPSRRVGVALLILALWSLVALSMGVAAVLVLRALSWFEWLAPLLLIPAIAQWIAMTLLRLPVRIRNGTLSFRHAGAWLPVTNVEALDGAVVLSSGPLRVRAQELVGIAKARDASETTSRVGPFVAPASAFLTTSPLSTAT